MSMDYPRIAMDYLSIPMDYPIHRNVLVGIGMGMSNVLVVGIPLAKNKNTIKLFKVPQLNMTFQLCKFLRLNGQSFDFMIVDSWSHIQEFQNILERTVLLSGTRLSNKINNSMFKILGFPKSRYLENDSVSFLCFSEVSWSPQFFTNWFWKSWSRPPGQKTMNMEGFRVFPRWNRKITGRHEAE